MAVSARPAQSVVAAGVAVALAESEALAVDEGGAAAGAVQAAINSARTPSDVRLTARP